MTPEAGDGRGGDVSAVDAATVLLLRDGGVSADGSDTVGGVEVWLLTRVQGMSFAAGMSAFPGGRVEPGDADLPVAGVDIAAMAARLACDRRRARAVLGAAVRETYEETGVLLSAPVEAGGARGSGGARGAGVARGARGAGGAADDAREIFEARAAVEAGTRDFGELLREHGLAVDGAAVQPWARWVTPVGEPLRYDTWFFVAALPPGAQPRDVTSESSRAEWTPVALAIEQAQRGERKLLPPTLTTLAALLPFQSVTEALAAAAQRPLDAVRPTLQMGEDGTLSVLLDDGEVMPIPSGTAR